MGEVSAYPQGTFCYVDLGAHDVGAAKRFYGGLLGWEFADVPAGDDTYSLCRLGGRLVAGIHPHGSDEPAFWASYIAVEDNAEATKRAAGLGAEVLIGPVDIPNTARMSYVRDPAGAGVALWEARGLRGAELVNDVGAWCWNELVTPHLDVARDFYSRLLGWNSVALSRRRGIFGMGELFTGGLHTPLSGESDAPRWTVTFAVDDADVATAEAQRLGGGVLVPPTDIPRGRVSVVEDPDGAELVLAAFPGPVLGGVDGS